MSRSKGKSWAHQVGAAVLTQRKAGLIADIRASFRDVDRRFGVSWSESSVIDGYGPEEECARARQLDTDTHWTDVLQDPEWEPSPGHGGFSFLDAIGFRYYLPAAMIWTLNHGESSLIDFHLTAQLNNKGRKRIPGQWSTLTPTQCRTVARFLQYMVDTIKADRRTSDSVAWQEALDSHWAKFIN